MIGRALLVLMTVVLAAGCREPATELPAEVEEHSHAGEHAAPAAEDAEPVLRIDREMLRDLRVTTAAAEARASGEGVTALGELRVDEDAYAEVGAPVAARVVKVLAGLGDAVHAGQPLVELRSVELGRARAEHLRARARAQVTRQALDRTRGLAAERIAPQRALQEAEADAAVAAAELAAAEAALDAIGVGREGAGAGSDDAVFVLRAPIAGTVIDRHAVQGQMAEPSAVLMRIADLSRLWLVVHAFERDAVRIRPGTAVRVSFPALPGRTFAGTVALLGQHVDAGSRTIPVRVAVGNAEGLLRPGMSATAWLPLGAAGERVVAVPAAALQRCDAGWCVFLPRGEGVFEVRSVGRGRDLGGEVEVVSGLQAGETIVVDGAFLLRAEAERAAGEGGHHDH